MLLDTWERVSIDEVIERVEGGGGDARARPLRLFALASSSEGLLAIDLAVRDWARRDPAVAERLRRARRAQVGQPAAGGLAGSGG